MVYADASKPGLAEGFTRNNFTAMIEDIENEALKKYYFKKKFYLAGYFS
jgi:hypothetical protein